MANKENNSNICDEAIANKKKSIAELKKRKDVLAKEVEQLELDIYSADYGVYKAKYDFVTSKEYEEKIKEIRQEQKLLIKQKKGCFCSTEWTVSNSKREGQKMINRNMKMMLRAFNGECDSIISNVTYKNINTMETRLQKSYENINKLNTVLYTRITTKYFESKKQELFLVHEFHEKKYEEKEEARLINQQTKEEEKAQKEFEKAILKAEKEAAVYEKALEEARKELEKASIKEVSKLNRKILDLEAKLAEAEENKRAISQAQITKSGYVYIISNVGSFGEDVYKIGMTRRLP